MKPALKYADVFGQPDKWLARFEELKSLPAGTKLYAGKREFRLIHVWDSPHPPRLELSERIGHQVKGYQCRQGDVLLLELRAGEPSREPHEPQSQER